jgi:hypothetical protein
LSIVRSPESCAGETEGGSGSLSFSQQTVPRAIVDHLSIPLALRQAGAIDLLGAAIRAFVLFELVQRLALLTPRQPRSGPTAAGPYGTSNPARGLAANPQKSVATPQPVARTSRRPVRSKTPVEQSDAQTALN